MIAARAVAALMGVASVAVFAAPALAQSTRPGGNANVMVNTRLSRTAAWLGEPVVYTVELRCATPYDVLLDDLSGDRFKVDGGELIKTENDEETTADGIVRRISFTFAGYRADAAEMRIQAQPVRYYVRRGDAAIDGTPAGEVMVPPAVVSVRSALPDTGNLPDPRYPGPRMAPRLLAYARPVGLTLIAIGVLPVLFVAFNVAGGVRRAWAARAVRGARHRQQVSLDQLKETTPASDAERVEAFGQLDVLIRERLAAVIGADVRSLTPAEVRRTLQERSSRLPDGDIEALLATCEAARYAPAPPAAETWARAVRDAEEVLTATR